MNFRTEEVQVDPQSGTVCDSHKLLRYMRHIQVRQQKLRLDCWQTDAELKLVWMAEIAEKVKLIDMVLSFWCLAVVLFSFGEKIGCKQSGCIEYKIGAVVSILNCYLCGERRHCTACSACLGLNILETFRFDYECEFGCEYDFLAFDSCNIDDEIFSSSHSKQEDGRDLPQMPVYKNVSRSCSRGRTCFQILTCLQVHALIQRLRDPRNWAFSVLAVCNIFL